ncbi:MAG: hypothetical protein KTR23_13195 [Rhodospirillales bacterium]|nr:hypothetical protein [Rhodospirillales bacterium]
MRALTPTIFVIFFVALSYLMPAARAQSAQPILDVVYPLRVEAEKGPHDFILATLKLALDKSERRYEMRASDIPMQQTRAMEHLRTGKDITVYWAGTSPEFEAEFQPIRMPIMRGLLGYRLFIIHKDQQSRFNEIETVSQLSHLTAGQGLGWSDIQILENAGLPVSAAPYEYVFSLVNSKRLDYFPRGVTEAFPELKEFGPENPNIAIEKRLLLVYPFAMFFFVNKDNPDLANAITTGFEKAYMDGSFQALFSQHPHIRSIIDGAHLSTRTRLEIPNPFLTAETRRIPEKYWYKEESILYQNHPASKPAYETAKHTN